MLRLQDHKHHHYTIRSAKTRSTYIQEPRHPSIPREAQRPRLMHVRADIAAVKAGSFAPVRLLKRRRGHSVQNVSFSGRVNDAPLFQSVQIHQTIQSEYSRFSEFMTKVL